MFTTQIPMEYPNRIEAFNWDAVYDCEAEMKRQELERLLDEIADSDS